jgi:hypothetical protein
MKKRMSSMAIEGVPASSRRNEVNQRKTGMEKFV